MDTVITLASFFGVYLWFKWYTMVASDQLSRFRRNISMVPLLLVPLLCGGIILYVMVTLSASDVRSDVGYILLYTGMGIIWLRAGEWFFRYLGISAEFDVVERGNLAAFLAYSGALIGLTFCFCGGNIGEGPGSEVVVFSSGLATIGFFLVWYILILLTEIDSTVNIGRDIAGGLRLAGFLVAASLILGRSAAGNWISYEATLSDFFNFGWPVLVLLAAAIVVELRARPTVESPQPSPVLYGLLPLAVYIAGAVAYLVFGRFPA
jgi:uncharacterized membrane protein YjfL (UPF0719 family)